MFCFLLNVEGNERLKYLLLSFLPLLSSIRLKMLIGNVWTSCFALASISKWREKILRASRRSLQVDVSEQQSHWHSEKFERFIKTAKWWGRAYRCEEKNVNAYMAAPLTLNSLTSSRAPLHLVTWPPSLCLVNSLNATLYLTLLVLSPLFWLKRLLSFPDHMCEFPTH